MSGRERVVAASFLALGAGLVVSSYALPAGLARVPGPGFFPRAIGGVIILLSLGWLWQARPSRRTSRPEAGDLRTVLLVVGLLFLYLVLWGEGPFTVRTALFLLLLLRLLGQPWKAGVALSLTLTAAVVLAFQVGLGVPLE